MSWYYLSFVKSGRGFLGACIVEGADVKGAIENATDNGLNPGGEIAVWRIGAADGGPLPKYRLMSRAEMEDLDGGPGKNLGEMEPAQRERLHRTAAFVHAGCNPASRRGV